MKAFGRRTGRFLAKAGAVLCLLYLALLIPESETATLAGAGGSPFVWRQDAFWSELQGQFVEARAAGCRELAGPIASLLSELDRLQGRLSATALSPQDELFAALETNLFRLAPLVAACPEGLSNYLAAVTRARAEVKRHSEHWDLGSVPVRQRLYRLLFGGRMAIEEVMLQAPPGIEVPQLVAGRDEPSRTPATRILGVTVHSGDILVSRGGAPTSALIARGNDYPGSFSHVALVRVDDQSGSASVIESHIERGVAVASIEEYLRDQKLRVLVLRPRADLPALLADPMLPHRAASRAWDSVRRGHIPYDFAMNHRDHQAQFCSEVVSAAYEAAGLKLWRGLTYISSPTVVAWLGSLGVRYFETQEPADLEYDPQLRVVAEWRERSTLFKAHVDDAVTDVMLEDAPAGRALPYQPWLLPPTRFAKAYSVVLNAFGKTGPVPEGMSATVALRVKKFRRDHQSVAAGVLALAGAYERDHGYAPPYWELIKLARQAGRDLGMVL